MCRGKWHLNNTLLLFLPIMHLIPQQLNTLKRIKKRYMCYLYKFCHSCHSFMTDRLFIQIFRLQKKNNIRRSFFFYLRIRYNKLAFFWKSNFWQISKEIETSLWLTTFLLKLDIDTLFTILKTWDDRENLGIFRFFPLTQMNVFFHFFFFLYLSVFFFFLCKRYHCLQHRGNSVFNFYEKR